MNDKSLLDISTIAGGSVVSYASLIGDMENWLGLLLIVFTLILTLMRIFIAFKQWPKRKHKTPNG